MLEPSIAQLEAERLAELHSLDMLDTAPEDCFDRITRTAQRLFNVPMALVSLVDRERQWFKSKQGWDATETPRNLAFCAHAILNDGLFLVEDAADDARFADNPLVTGAPHIRFYAGWTLHGPQGHRVGTLAILDRTPRTLSEADLDAMRDLALWAESELNNRSLRQATAALQQSESRLQTVVENVADAIITLDAHGLIESINRAAVRIFGYHQDEVIGQNIKVLMPSMYHHAHDHHLRDYRDTGRTRIIGMDREVTGRRKDGTLFPMELTVNEMWLHGRRGFVGIVRDITERRENERKLREKDILLQAVMDSTSSFVFVRDTAGHFLYVNKEYERLFNLAPGEVIGKTVEQVFDPELAARHRTKDRAVLTGKPGLRMEDEVHLEERQSTFLVVRSGLFNDNGEIYGTCGVGTDITQRKRADHFKNEFISTVSHELRTPLTSIRGSLGLLIGGVAGDIPDGARALLDIANNNCERLGRLINDILDIEKIESGNMRFELVAQRMLPLVEQAIAATRGFAAQYQVKFELQPPAQEAQDALVAVDADRIMQVIVNLLSNAAKFSPAGSTVQVRLAQQAGCVRLSVIDRGQGISHEFRERIFQKFAQADSSTTRQKGGTGLGLSISRAIIERHHGRIDFDSDPGRMTEFYFELPPAAMPLDHAISHGRVLIVEDDSDIARLLGLMLQQAGLSSDIARDARQARRLLAAVNYEAMTLDLALPGEDGVSLLRWMRTQDRTRSLPVVVVSANTDAARRELTGGAIGIIDWIAKPIDESRLVAALQTAMHGRRVKTPHVLHVEDDADLTEVMHALLSPAFCVQHAGTLAEARGKLADQAFSLILLDLQLPDGHGSELLGTLPPLNATTPVVVFSAAEADQPAIESVHAALVKSRTSNEHLLAILQGLIGQPNQDPE